MELWELLYRSNSYKQFNFTLFITPISFLLVQNLYYMACHFNPLLSNDKLLIGVIDTECATPYVKSERYVLEYITTQQ